MKIINTPIKGLHILEPKVFEDTRGKFIKTFNDDFFKKHNLDITIKETYYSLSHKGVIRGMHFQIPPSACTKLVYVSSGEILDVVLDIREKSPTYGQSFSIELSSKNARVLIIPKGLAHGFKSLQNNTNVTYMQTASYNPNDDAGILYNSFGFDWGENNLELSQRDLSFLSLEEFKTPFKERV